MPGLLPSRNATMYAVRAVLPLSVSVSLALALAIGLGTGCASAVPVSDAAGSSAESAQPGVDEAVASDETEAPVLFEPPPTPAPAPEKREATWSQLMKRGRIHLEAGELPEAEDRLTRAFDRTTDFRDGDPRTATTLRNLERVAVAYRNAGHSPGFARVLELLSLISETRPAARTPELATLLQELATTRTLQGRHEDARAALEKARALLTELHGPEDPALVGVHAQLGLTLIDLGDLTAAEAEIDRAAEIGTAVGGADSPLFARSLVPRARLAVVRDQTEDAREALQRAIDIHVEHDGEESTATARVVRERALFEVSQGENAAAEMGFDRVIAIWDALPREHYQRAQSRNELAWFLVETGQPEQAEAPARSALGILEERGIDGQPFAAVADTLATALRDQQKYEEAEALYQQALEEGAEAGPLPGWDLAAIAERFAVLLDQTGRGGEAEELRSRWESRTKLSDS